MNPAINTNAINEIQKGARTQIQLQVITPSSFSTINTIPRILGRPIRADIYFLNLS